MRRARKLKLAPLSDDARDIAKSLELAASGITAFASDERLKGHTLSRDFCTEQATYYASMAADWANLATRLSDAGS